MSSEASIDAISAGMRRPTATILLSMGLVALASFLLLRGYEFYALSIGNRPIHEDYRLLSPTGLIGQGYGFVGTGLIILNLLYLVRRRFAGLPLGSLRVWLEIHVFTGLAGSVLVLFHSAFQLRNLLTTVTAGALLLVVITGIVGRYLVGVAPSSNTDALDKALIGLDELIEGVSGKVRKGLLEAPFTRTKMSQGLVVTLARVPKWMADGRKRANVVKSVVTEHAIGLDSTDARLLKRVTKVAASAARDEVRAEAAVAVLRVWRRLHRFFAILMLLAVSVHIGVAWHFGYRWIFSQ